MEDQQIIDLYWARDQEAIAASDQKYGRRCRSISVNILSDPEDAEECVNDTWHRAWITMPPRRPHSLGAYLMAIVRNLSIDRWRIRTSQKRGCGAELLLGELEECVPAAKGTEEAAEDREIIRIIDKWLDSLPEEERRLFLRRYWYGFAVADLACELGEPPNRTAQHLHRLRTKLRSALEKEGISV